MGLFLLKKKARCYWDFFQCPGEKEKEIFLLVLGKGYHASYCDEHALIKTELLKKSKLAIYKNLIEIENRIRQKKRLISKSNSNVAKGRVYQSRTKSEIRNQKSEIRNQKSEKSRWTSRACFQANLTRLRT